MYKISAVKKMDMRESQVWSGYERRVELENFWKSWSLSRLGQMILLAWLQQRGFDKLPQPSLTLLYIYILPPFLKMFLVQVEFHLFPLSSLQPLPGTLSPNPSMSPLLLILFFDCYVHMYMQINKYSLLNLLLLFVCMWFHGWPLCIGQPVRRLTHLCGG